MRLAERLATIRHPALLVERPLAGIAEDDQVSRLFPSATLVGPVMDF